MANSTLANLTASGALTGTELFYSDNGAQDVKVTANQLKTFIVGAGAVSVASGKTLTVSNTLTFTGTDGASLNVGAGGTLGTAAFVNTGTSGGAVPLLNAGNTFSATQTLTPAANTQGLVVSGYSLTGANAQSLLDLSGTLNTSGNPAAIKLNLTNTASGTTSKFADFQLGGTSKINLSIGGTTPAAIVNIAGNNFGGWAIINGSDAGVSNNFELFQAYWASNVAVIDSNKVGSGANRTLSLRVGSAAVLDLNGAGGNAVTLVSSTAIPAGGTAGLGYKFSSTANFGVFFGSGAPTLSAAQGSLYIRSDGSATNNRAYINTDGSTTWTALTTAA
jgi:hypothetical protein